MRHRWMLLAGLFLLPALAPASAGARPMVAHTAGTATVELRSTAIGEILVDSSGLTVFEFSKDKKNRDVCQTIAGCPGTWPLLATTGMPTGGPGVNPKLLGEIAVGMGEQVTYNGRPLYGYIGNSAPGETSYVGVKEFGGTWYAMNAKGKKVKPKKAKKTTKSKEAPKEESPWY